MTSLTRLINLTAAFHATRSAAQVGIFFDNMADMIAKLTADGHNVTQPSSDRALVNNAVWITVYGVTYPA
jgi:hypothetical protein